MSIPMLFLSTLNFFVQFAGIDRETTPFVLTREMVFIMGGQNSELFQKFCVIFFFHFLEKIISFFNFQFFSVKLF